MKVDSANFEAQSREAVKLFWGNRQTALARQIESGRKDEGGRGAVTSGKNMDGFRALTRSLAVANGLDPADVSAHARVLTLPGYFRPTKFWDTLAILRDDLLAAVEFKSQVGPSFGKNFNNWCEEAIGSSHDFWTAYRMGAFGEDAPRPFLAWIMLLEDCDASNSPVKESDPRFPVDPAFQGTSYAERYDLFCKRLVEEGLYSSETLLISPREAVADGSYRHLSEMTSLRTYAKAFADHVAAAAN